MEKLITTTSQITTAITSNTTGKNTYAIERTLSNVKGDTAIIVLLYPTISSTRPFSEDDYFFIIDEINRGNLSKIFGELFMLIESDKRGNDIQLLYSSDKFSVPKNVYIIGMMNTADRSLAIMKLYSHSIISNPPLDQAGDLFAYHPKYLSVILSVTSFIFCLFS